MGVQYRDNHENFHTNTLKEYEQSEDFAYTQPEMVDNIYNSILKRDGVENEHFTKDQIKNNVLDKAHKQDPADGQGYYSIDFEREMALRYGYHTNELEQAYKYEGLVFRKYIMEQELSPEQEKELSDLEQLITSDPEKYGIGVRKVTYFGALQNSTVDAKAYDKLSIAPLVPSDVKDKPILRELLKNMVQKQVGYVKYESGTKLFKTQPVNIEDLGHSLHDQYQTELLKLQIKPKEVQTSTTAIPTQMMKLIFSNLFDGGKPRSERAGQLYQNYLDSLKSIQGVQTKRLLDELGFSKEGVDMSKLSERLIAQAKAQGLNSTTIEALQVRNGNFIGVLEESGFINQITDLIAGMADTKLRRYEFPGGDFVLISDANRWEKPEDRLKFYTYTDGATQALECRITLTGEHSKLLKLTHPTDKQPIATRDRLNSLLKNKKWVKEHEKELTVILDRVPTQGPNSMDFAIVKEFLSPTMGSAIVLPEEIVYKSGTDFDFDKEKVLLPSLTKDGKYIGDISHVEEELETLRQQRKDLLTEDTSSETHQKQWEKSGIY
jgi:hypothetical protein